LINRKVMLLCGGVALSPLAAHAQAQAPTASPAQPLAVGQAADKAGQEPQSATDVGEVVVTGTRLNAAGFNAPTPVTVLGAEELQKRNPATMGEVLNELPSFRASSGPGSSTRGLASAGQILPDLRGLGAPRTLTLVNGRRFALSAATQSSDMAAIPQSLVKQVDIVTGGASAAYGSDAVAGVVNLILDTDFRGFRGSVQYGASQRNDAKEGVFSLGYGGEIGERFHFQLGGDYAKNEGTGNFYSRDAFRDEVGLVGYGTTRPANLPSQGFERDVELLYTPGGLILTPGALQYTAFNPDGTPYRLQTGQIYGTTMVGSTANYGQNPNHILQMYHPFERKNLMAAADFDLTDHIQLFTELNYSNLSNAGSFGDTYQNTQIINRANPFVPASVRAAMLASTPSLQTITVGRSNTDITPWYSDTEWKTERFLGGVRGDFDLLHSNWTWEAYVSRSRTIYEVKLPAMVDLANLMAAVNVVSDGNGNPVCGPIAGNPNLTTALAAAVQPGCVPFNVFGQTNTQAAIDYVTNPVLGRNDIRQDVAAFSVSGSPFSLPAGEVSIAFGAELREVKAEVTADERSRLNAFASLNQPEFSGSNSVKEGFLEIGVPVLRDLPFAKSLDLNGAIRRTDYELSGGVTTWKYGATYEPTDWLRFRATQSRDIRAPNLQELFTTGTQGSATGVLNPFNGQVGRVSFRPGGNPNLRPEVADSFTTGVVFQPKWGYLDGLRASVDFYRIKISDMIGTPSVPDTLLRCFRGEAALCANVDFDNTTYGIALVRTPNFNLAELETEGFDIEVEYKFPPLPFNIPGRLTFHNLTTRVNKLIRDDNITRVDGAGFASYSNGGVNKLVGNATLNYDLDALNVNLQARYFGDVGYSPLLVGPDDPAYDPTASNSISRNLFPGQVIYNLGFQYKIRDDERGQLEMYGVINNVLDQEPDDEGAVAFNNQSVQYYDTIGRYFRLGVRFKY
jgi:iron complex outermembrane receptor protein